MAESRDFLIGVLVGSAIGAAAALMYAPAAGTETRRMLKDRANEAATQARGKAGELVQTAQARVDDLKYQAQNRVGQVTERVTGVIDQAKQTVEHQREAVKSAVDAGRQAYQEKQSTLHQNVASDTTALPEPPATGGGAAEPV